MEMTREEKRQVLLDLAESLKSDHAEEDAAKLKRRADRLKKHDERFGIKRGFTIGIPEDRDD